MSRNAGFTLIELMIVVVVIGILAAIAIPNFQSMQARAREGGVKANMHSFQLSAEDYGVQNDGAYATTGDIVVALIPGGQSNFKNSFTGHTGENVAWETRSSYAGPATSTPGITSYKDSVATSYNVKGFGQKQAIPIVLTSGY
ncbi:MAG TPA: prepilin-type N-terminal cleavage/methylation domain-containing protein [Thermoanaerobaculaceae bacterium]|nr:prepilin-type N-terminal cleavage/methylation domain-containing protein [Thermoanaerobaculaceae bacterium]